MMRPLRRFEKRLEKLFEEPFAKTFKGGVHPLEIAHRLIGELEDAKLLGVSGILAPNHFVVHLSPSDHERLSGVAVSLASELETLIISHANRSKYQMVTRPLVEFQRDGALGEGEFSVLAILDEPAGAETARKRPGAGQQQAGSETRLGVLDILQGEKAGTSFDLDMEKTRIGRAEGNDLVLADPRTSRFHAEIAHTPSGYVLKDLGSTNGTIVQGRKVLERLLEDGDVLVVGGTEMRFALKGRSGPGST